jgi:hypothetical protein
MPVRHGRMMVMMMMMMMEDDDHDDGTLSGDRADA